MEKGKIKEEKFNKKEAETLIGLANNEISEWKKFIKEVIKRTK